VLVALIFSGFTYWKFKTHFWVWFIVAVLSYDLHIIMDVFTGERGVMLLWPLVQDRISFPVKLFVGVQWGQGIFSIWHVWTILSETLFFLLIFLLLQGKDRLVASRVISNQEEHE
jgi:hypothetical protein